MGKTFNNTDIIWSLLLGIEVRNEVASYSIYVETIRGHEYIILRGMYFGDIIHSASCPCKKGGEQ